MQKASTQFSFCQICFFLYVEVGRANFQLNETKVEVENLIELNFLANRVNMTWDFPLYS